MKLHTIEKSVQSHAPKKELGFKQLDENTLCLQFGATAITLHADGRLEFSAGKTQLVMQNDEVKIEAHNNNIRLQANGDVQINGKNIRQTSKQDIKLTAKHDLLLNSH